MIDRYYSESVSYYDDNEIEEASLYLKLWKKFLLRRLPKHVLVDENLICKPSIKDYLFCQKGVLSIKLCVSFDEADHETPPM